MARLPRLFKEMLNRYLICVSLLVGNEIRDFVLRVMSRDTYLSMSYLHPMISFVLLTENVETLSITIKIMRLLLACLVLLEKFKKQISARPHFQTTQKQQQSVLSNTYKKMLC